MVLNYGIQKMMSVSLRQFWQYLFRKLSVNFIFDNIKIQEFHHLQNVITDVSFSISRLLGYYVERPYLYYSYQSKTDSV